MSIRTQPPHSRLPRALLENTRFHSSLCVYFCLFETSQEEISAHKEEVLPFWCGSVQSALASMSTLSCQESVKRDVGGNADAFTWTFKDTKFYFVGVCCLDVSLKAHTKKVEGTIKTCVAINHPEQQRSLLP